MLVQNNSHSNTCVDIDINQAGIAVKKCFFAKRWQIGFIFNICRNVEGMMEMYSEELKILDRNTVKYMVDQMQEQIDNQKEKIAAQEKEIQMLKRKLEEQK